MTSTRSCQYQAATLILLSLKVSQAIAEVVYHEDCTVYIRRSDMIWPGWTISTQKQMAFQTQWLSTNCIREWTRKGNGHINTKAVLAQG